MIELTAEDVARYRAESIQRLAARYVDRAALMARYERLDGVVQSLSDQMEAADLKHGVLHAECSILSADATEAAGAVQAIADKLAETATEIDYMYRKDAELALEAWAAAKPIIDRLESAGDDEVWAVAVEPFLNHDPVLVGPYASSEEANAAHAALVARYGTIDPYLEDAPEAARLIGWDDAVARLDAYYAPGGGREPWSG